MPFVTICPIEFMDRQYTNYTKGQNKTLMEFYQQTPSAQSFIVDYDGSNTFYFGQDQSWESLLDKVTFKDFVMVAVQRLVRCATLNTAKLHLPLGIVTVSLRYLISFLNNTRHAICRLDWTSISARFGL